MKRIFRVLLFFAVCAFAAYPPQASADPKAFYMYGMYDPTLALNNSQYDCARVNAVLKRVYDEFGVSVFMIVTTPEQGSDGRAEADDFIETSVEPYLGVSDLKRGIVVVWDGRAKEYAARWFHNVDYEELPEKEMFKLYPGEFLDKAVSDVWEARRRKPSSDELFEPFAWELYGRARVIYTELSANSYIPQSLEAPAHFNVTLGRPNEHGMIVDARFDYAVPKSVLDADANPDIIVTFELDWKIDDGAWASENGDKGIRGFGPDRVSAHAPYLETEIRPGDLLMDTREHSYSFRAWFEFTQGGKTVRSPFTDTVTAGKK